MQLIFGLVCLFLVAFGALVGFFRRAYKMLVRLATLILSVFLSLGFSKWLVKLGVDTVIEQLLPQLLQDPDLQASLLENPALTESISVVAQMLAAPILFIAIYLVAKLVTFIVYKIVCAIFRIRGPKLFGIGRIAGLAVGAICGLVSVLVLVTPVFGYVELVGETMELVSTNEEGESEIPEELAMVLEITEAPVARQVYDMFGRSMFESLTTTKWDGENVSLSGEIHAIASAVKDAGALTRTPMEEYDSDEITAVRNVVTDIDESALLSHLGSGLLSGASKSWLEGKDFIGIAAPETEENMQGILNAFFRVFSTSDHTNLGTDLTTFADFLAVLVESGTLKAIGDENADFAAQLTETTLVGDLYGVLDANERMYPVKIAISDAGMRIMLNQIGSSVDELRETHGELLDDMAVALKQVPVDENGNIDKATLTTDINTALQESGVEVDESAVQLVTDGFVDEFTAEELQTLSSDEIIDRLLNRFEGIEPSELAGVLPQS